MLWAIIASVILSGISLAMDAFAVSICDGMVYRNLTKGKAVVMPITFGIFQAVMPIIGFYIGMAFNQIDAFDAVDHWIAFALLFIIGGKMIYDGIKELRAKEEELKIKQFSLPEVLVQGVATSIDALFVGFSLNAMLEGVTNVQAWAWISVGIIGVITFIISLIGVIIGVKVGQLFRKKASVAEIIGGVVLIGIALKILIEGLL
ncbi:MAG: manganese efflux pump MntP family protein [Clostridia bacterium]|nr:manganese efflux pump MntP family protein [Clostridia bacterium]